MNKKLPLYLQSCFHFFTHNFKRKQFLLFCFLTVSFASFSQGPGCPNVYAGEDVELDCGQSCTDLTASFLDTGETTSYEVSSIPYDPPFPFTGGTPVSVNIDDRWSEAIQLPFDFCFFGETYTEMIIGSNAVVSFDLINNIPGGTCDWSFDESIPDPNLFFTTIFGPYMDVDPSVGGSGQINWTVFGESPCRTMVVNFPDIPYYRSDCNFLTLTSQVVIYETTNVVEVYVQDRPNGCTWNDGNAVLGIQNQDGSLGYTPPGRNTGNWSASNEAWRFTPNGMSNVVFSWLDGAGTVIGTDPTVTVCPTDTSTTYTAQAIYTNCNGDEVTETDEVTVTRIGSFSVDVGDDMDLCDAQSYDITAEIIGGDPADATFLWSTGETTQTITVTTSGTYSVEVTIGTCTVTASVTINFYETPLIELGNDIATCFFDPVILDATPSNYNPADVTYEWSLDGTILPGETNPTITANSYGVYSVLVNIASCSATDQITILPQDLQVSLGNDFSSCFENPVVLEAEALDFDPALATFEWSLNGTIIPDETTAFLTVTTAGTYTVVATVGECSATDTVIITLGDVEIELGDDFQTCFDQPVILDASPSNYDPQEANYEWSLNGTVLAGEVNPMLTISEIGTYSVLVTVGNCTAIDTITVSFRDDLEVSLGEDFQVCANEPRTLTATTAEEGASYQWFLNGNLIGDETNSTLDIMIAPETLGAQTYTVVISVGGCSGTDSVDINLYEVGNCVISQGLSPNGDGFNDTLDLTFLNDRAGINKLQIFNRLGSLVFEQNNYTNQWRGQTNDGNDLPTGTYFYVIDLAGNDAVYGSQATGWIYLNQEAN
ncbi:MULTISPECIES: gliding motility-associated C-terminal domain-containing protein [Aequorivita]|uniref:Gliding motility-associated C-terminal domain-containing protein n=1 Tax=Aequorivita iocasae TaxID=2803865 RepID=A0ABX7DUL2_9FLAO|nr:MULTISPECIES: gliding motility-associated C-terminal domain-containing protein [Aequorivita]QQX77437.1 gliding motility-associated C-terminal domain-containing protein [Aequorivita iocasae]UCA56928.1 gliding motility-associated C-terminal domain-containing protein [Aequorivita sp. F7]